MSTQALARSGHTVQNIKLQKQDLNIYNILIFTNNSNVNIKRRTKDPSVAFKAAYVVTFVRTWKTESELPFEIRFDLFAQQHNIMTMKTKTYSRSIFVEKRERKNFMDATQVDMWQRNKQYTEARVLQHALKSSTSFERGSWY